MAGGRWLLLVGACAIAPVIAIAFGSPPGYALLAIPLVLTIWRASGVGSAFVLVVSSGAALVAYAGVLRATGLDQAIYYRFHERFATWSARLGHRAYLPGVDYRSREYGDLQMFTQERIAEPREVVFHSDSDGFRNDHDYAGEPWVLVGDSFVMGAGTTQSELLQACLARRGIRAYNLAHPGGVLDYEAYWRSFVARHGRASRPLLFLFEGNDFPETVDEREQPALLAAFDRGLRGVIAPLTRLSTYRVTRSLIARAAKRGALYGETVFIRPLAGKPMAFLVRYTEHARAPQLEDMALTDAAFARMAPELAAAFFIPDKYRVYQPWVAPDERLPNASWEHLAQLCEQYHVRCVDLTPGLLRRSEELLPEGRFTWWRDDHHWNGDGIDAAAERVAEVIHELGGNP